MNMRRIKQRSYANLKRARTDDWFRKWFWLKVLGKIPTDEFIAGLRAKSDAKFHAWQASDSKLPFLKWAKKEGIETP